MDLETYYWGVGFLMALEAHEFEGLAATMSRDGLGGFGRYSKEDKLRLMLPLDTSDRLCYYYEKKNDIHERGRVNRDAWRFGQKPDIAWYVQTEDRFAHYCQTLGLRREQTNKLRVAFGLEALPV